MLATTLLSALVVLLAALVLNGAMTLFGAGFLGMTAVATLALVAIGMWLAAIELLRERRVARRS